MIERGRRLSGIMPCMWTRNRVLIPALLLALVGSACEDAPQTDGARTSLVVFVATSIHDAVREAADEFEQRHDVRVRLSAAASGILRRQIEMGAPCEVFVSADAEHMDLLDRASRIDRSTRCDVASNTLVVISTDAHERAWTTPNRLASPAVDRVALGNPDYVPVGKYGRAALEHLGLWSSVEPKTVFADSAGLLLEQMDRGGLRFGIAYASDVRGDSPHRIVYRFERSTHPPIRYPVAAVAAQRPAHPLAAGFCKFLAGDEARAIFVSHGFDEPANPAGPVAPSKPRAPAEPAAQPVIGAPAETVAPVEPAAAVDPDGLSATARITPAVNEASHAGR